MLDVKALLMVSCKLLYYIFWFSGLVGLINLVLRIEARCFSAFIPGRSPSVILKRKVRRFCRLLSCSEGRSSSRGRGHRLTNIRRATKVFGRKLRGHVGFVGCFCS